MTPFWSMLMTVLMTVPMAVLRAHLRCMQSVLPHCMLSALPHCMQVYCDQPSLRVEQLSKAAADARRAEQVLASDHL